MNKGYNGPGEHGSDGPAEYGAAENNHDANPDRGRSNINEANKVEVNKVDPCDRQTNIEKSENFRKILKIY